MKRTIQYQNGFPTTLRLIIYIILISAVCFLTCLFTGAQDEPTSMENTNWEILND